MIGSKYGDNSVHITNLGPSDRLRSFLEIGLTRGIGVESGKHQHLSS